MVLISHKSQKTTIANASNANQYKRTHIKKMKLTIAIDAALALCLSSVVDARLRGSTTMIPEEEEGGRILSASNIHKTERFTTIQNLDGGKCLDALRTKYPDGTPVENYGSVYEYHCHGRENQQWEFVEVAGQNTYMIKNKDSGMCLDANQTDGPKDGNVYEFPCHGLDNQLWILWFNDNNLDYDEFKIVNRETGMCLDALRNMDGNGNRREGFGNVVEYTCSSNENQVWRIEGLEHD